MQPHHHHFFYTASVTQSLAGLPPQVTMLLVNHQKPKRANLTLELTDECLQCSGGSFLSPSHFLSITLFLFRLQMGQLMCCCWVRGVASEE